MRFFLPHAEDDPELAEQTLTAIRKFATETTGWRVSDRRIFRMSYVHDGKWWVAEVGKPFEGDEPAFAILESQTYLVCTPNRGVVRGMPILVGLTEVHEVEDFDQEEGPNG